MSKDSPQKQAMGELGSPFPISQVGAEEIHPRTHAVIWLTTTLVFSLLPFALIPFAYHAIHDPPEWPNTYDLFGRGDIALVVIAVFGSSVAELVQVSRASLAARAILVAISSVSGMIAIAIYAIAQYQILAEQQPDLVVNAYTLGGLLTTVVLIQCLLISFRRSGA